MDSKATIDSGMLTGQMQMKVVPRGKGRRSVFKTLPLSEEKYIRSSPDGSILVEAIGANGMFQLYYLPRMNLFYGNFYEKNGPGSFTREGTVSLLKQN